MDNTVNEEFCDLFLIEDAIRDGKHHADNVKDRYCSPEEEEYVSPTKDQLEEIQEALDYVDYLEKLFETTRKNYLRLKSKRDKINFVLRVWIMKRRK